MSGCSVRCSCGGSRTCPPTLRLPLPSGMGERKMFFPLSGGVVRGGGTMARKRNGHRPTSYSSMVAKRSSTLRSELFVRLAFPYRTIRGIRRIRIGHRSPEASGRGTFGLHWSHSRSAQRRFTCPENAPRFAFPAMHRRSISCSVCATRRTGLPLDITALAIEREFCRIEQNTVTRATLLSLALDKMSASVVP